MTINTLIIEGFLRTYYNSEDFEAELNSTKSSLIIKAFSKKLLIQKQAYLKKDHAIYILEGPTSCYIGKSTDIKSRINNHKDKNTSEFLRCFILLKKDTDLRGYLDYMEAYTIQKMSLLGYKLDNSKKPNPDDDILPDYKKEMAKGWIEEFLSVFPMLGFKKVPNIVKLQPSILNKDNYLHFKLNGNSIIGKNSIDSFIKLLQSIGLDTIEKQCSKIFSSSFKLSKTYEKPKYGSCYELIENNQVYYLYSCISKSDLYKKANKIKGILQLNLDIL